MNTKKKLTEMNLDELYSEIRILDNSIPSIKNTKYLIFSILFMAITILMAIFAMKDNFSYILTGIVLYMIYFFIQRIIHRKKLLKK